VHRELLQHVSFATAARVVGLALQFFVLLIVYWRLPDLVNAYVESLFLSTIGLSVTKAGANFATLRGASYVQRKEKGERAVLVLAARITLGGSAIGLATLFAASSEVPYAAFPGILLGLAHNSIYRGFLSGSKSATVGFALFGFVHFGFVLGVLLLSRASLPHFDPKILAATAVLSLLFFAYVSEGNVALGIAELAYAYAYPLFIYVASSGFSAGPLWTYFFVAKLVDAASMLVSFLFQPWFYRHTEPVRRSLMSRARTLQDRAFLFNLGLIALTVGFSSSLRPEYETVFAALCGFSVAFSFLLTSIGGYMFVTTARDTSWILAYGFALSLLPLAFFLFLSANGFPGAAFLSALSAVGMINHLIARIEGMHR
jgi:hypothetical protein